MSVLRVLTAAFAIASGIIVLLGYFLPVPTLMQLRSLLTDWAIILAGTAVLVGILNLVAVQMEKVRTGQKSGIYGALLVLALIVTFGFGLLLGPDDPLIQWTVDAIIVPVEASLMSLLTVTLIYASIRLLRRRADVMSVLFLLVALLFLSAVLFTAFSPALGDGLMDLVGMFSRGGTRGLLLGIALGTLLTGMRVLFGIDRPYGGN
ncbi:MAG TPA: hypothetical protein VNK49_03130 [Anaerolineales bacterium]|nr:hypothetical protein [Anaerolineales bacterium]